MYECMCVCVYMSVCMCVRVYVCTCACVWRYGYVRMKVYVCMHVSKYVRMLHTQAQAHGYHETTCWCQLLIDTMKRHAGACCAFTCVHLHTWTHTCMKQVPHACSMHAHCLPSPRKTECTCKIHIRLHMYVYSW